jgi:NAD(P)-dependent dehydrogenase (short-subunit alcohol dehydrogenase family)
MTTDADPTTSRILEGRVAIVTGGGTGLGAETCRRLAAAGTRIAIGWSRSRSEAEAVAAELPEAVAVGADVRDEAAVAAMIDEVEDRLGGVDLLVNNAGVTTYAPYDDLDAIDRADWDTILGVNLIGAWNCSKAVAAGMRDRGSGAIVNVASDAAFTTDGSSIPYVVSKAGLVAMTRALAVGLAPEIRVNAIAPGWMDTPWLDRYVPADRIREIRSGVEPSVDVAVAADEIVGLLRSESLTGAVVQLEPGGVREIHPAP